MNEQDKILALHKFEIEETYREEGQRAGDSLVKSILRQHNFEPTSPKADEASRQSVQNEIVGGTTTEAEMNELAANEADDKERSIQADLTSMKAIPVLKVGQKVEFLTKDNDLYKGTIQYVGSDDARIESDGGYDYQVSIDDIYEVDA